MNSIVRILVIAFTLVLSACAVKPTAPAGPAPELSSQRVERLRQLDQWSLNGRVAISLKREGWTASLHWTQEQDHYNVRCMAPLGRGTWELDGRPGRVTLLTHENRLLLSTDPESLLRDTVGWELPVSGLRWWVLGVPEPSSAATRVVVDREGRLQQLEQSGWSIDYARYTTIDGMDLPQKLTLTNAELKVRLVVGGWSLPP